MTDLRVLITGGNGYVGRNLTQMMQAECSVCVADSLRFGHWRFSPDERSRMRLEHVDILDATAVVALLADFRPDVVVHLAAIHYIPECEADPAHAVNTNVIGTLNLLTACPEGCRFVLASSGAVYKPHDLPHQECSSEERPEDVYGYSKLHAEQYVRQFAAKRGLKAVIVRLFNVIGPGETNPHLLPELVAQLKAGRTVVELGNLTPRRDYIGVKDAARGFMAAALGESVPPGDTCTINLGTSNTYSVAEVIEKLRRISGVEFTVHQAAARIRKVDRMHLAADNQRAAELFGWRPRDSIDEVLTELWRAPDLAPALVGRYR